MRKKLFLYRLNDQKESDQICISGSKSNRVYSERRLWSVLNSGATSYTVYSEYGSYPFGREWQHQHTINTYMYVTARFYLVYDFFRHIVCLQAQTQRPAPVISRDVGGMLKLNTLGAFGTHLQFSGSGGDARRSTWQVNSKPARQHICLPANQLSCQLAYLAATGLMLY